MAREKRKFVCQECGYTTPKTLGRCPSCRSWQSFAEEIETLTTASKHRDIGQVSREPEPISQVTASDVERHLTGMAEFDRVLGGGIVPGSVVLIGGDPGIGKSTLLLQASDALSRNYGDVLYVSGEESVSQTKLRATRLGVSNLIRSMCCVKTIWSRLKSILQARSPKVVIVDSIQTVYLSSIPSAPGSVTQIRECAGHLLICAKNRNIPVFLVGHVTKEGALAGPRVLEHMVDTVLYFEGEQHHIYRILSSDQKSVRLHE